MNDRKIKKTSSAHGEKAPRLLRFNLAPQQPAEPLMVDSSPETHQDQSSNQVFHGGSNHSLSFGPNHNPITSSLGGSPQVHGHEASLFNLISENNEEIRLRLSKLEKDKNITGYEDQQSQAAASV